MRKTAASGRSYTYAGGFSTGGGGAVATTSINIGTGGFIVVGTSTQNTVAITSVVVNGVTLTQDAYLTNVGIFSGLVSGSGSVTVTVTWASGTFNLRGFGLWVLNGLTTNAKENSATFTTNPGTISVNAGDLMFTAFFANGTLITWSASTQVPAVGAPHNLTAGNPSLQFADWTIASTNAAFSDAPGVAANSAVVTYR